MSDGVQNMAASAAAADQSNPATKGNQLGERAATAEIKMRAAFATPIAFYGRLVDQNGEPVPDASVILNVNATPGHPPTRYNRKTDGRGEFSIDGVRGISVAVELSKPGYHAFPQGADGIGSSGLFEYAVPSVRGPALPDKEHPALFRLYKLGPPQNLATIPERRIRISRDGAPITIPLDSTTNHSIVIRCWSADVARPAEQRQYDWRAEIAVHDGGLQLRRDAAMFIAPDGGYFDSDTIEMAGSLPANEWRGMMRRSYFIRFDDGIYARADLELHPTGGFAVWQSYLNRSSGNRNLEAQ